MLKLYNTLTKKKDIFKPHNKKIVSMYTCGPTVYNYAHIGNFRSYLFSDIVKRTLILDGYSVKDVMNFTDIEDKTIRGALAEFGSKATTKNLFDYTTRYINIFKNDVKSLNIIPPTSFVRATAKLSLMKKMILALIKKGLAYEKDGSVYFNIKKYDDKFKDYSKLSGENFILGLKAGARIHIDEYEKQDVSDFVLWRGYYAQEDGNIFWDFKGIGNGRPGWHIECSAISLDKLGARLDIHIGGIDLIFPHHTNEIAQSQGYTGKTPFVKYWLHPDYLIVEGKKMSKSKGNFFTLKDITDKGFNPLAFRYLCLTTHYKMKLNFSFEALEGAQNSLLNLYREIESLRKMAKKEKIVRKSLLSVYQKEFLNALNEDFNTPQALACVWKVLKSTGLNAKEKYTLLLKFDEVLGLSLAKIKTAAIPEEITELAKKRERARNMKNWQESDHIRDLILEKGYIVEDTSRGSIIKKL